MCVPSQEAWRFIVRPAPTPVCPAIPVRWQGAHLSREHPKRHGALSCATRLLHHPAEDAGAPPFPRAVQGGMALYRAPGWRGKLAAEYWQGRGPGRLFPRAMQGGSGRAPVPARHPRRHVCSRLRRRGHTDVYRSQVKLKKGFRGNSC